MLGFGPAFSRLGNSVGFSNFLRRVIGRRQRVGGGRRCGGRSGGSWVGEGAEIRKGHDHPILVEKNVGGFM